MNWNELQRYVSDVMMCNDDIICWGISIYSQMSAKEHDFSGATEKQSIRTRILARTENQNDLHFINKLH